MTEHRTDSVIRGKRGGRNDGLHEAGGTHWTGERDKGQEIPNEMKTRWVRWLEPPKEDA